MLPHRSRHRSGSPSWTSSPDPCSGDHGRLSAWPGPDPVELADGSLVVSATSPRPRVIVVRAIGEIDLLTAPAWRRTLDAAVRIAASPARVGDADRPTPRLVCDLSATTFLGATGIGVLIDLAEQAVAAGVELRVVAGTRAVRRLLGLTGLDQRLAVETGLEHAVVPTPTPGAAS